MSEPRVLIWLSDLGGGGAQRTMLNLAATLPAQGLAVEVAVGQAAGLARQWAAPNLQFHELGGSRLAALIPSLARLIRSRKPDAILSTMVDANVAVYLAAKLAGTDAPIILRETNSHRARSDLGFVRRQLAGYAYRRGDQVIALSEGVRGELIEDMGLVSDRIVTIPNPVGVSAIARAAQQARDGAPPSGMVPGRPHIVAVGRLHRQKGIDILFDAFAKQQSDARLIVLGEGPERATLEAQAQRLGISERVFMPGFVADVNAYLAHSDLFVLSSRWEGFGHVIVEAMAAGLPVIATNCPYGPADILRHNETGWLVPPEDANALATAMSYALGERADARRVAAAGAKAAERYESSCVAGEYAAMIREAIARRKSLRSAGKLAGRNLLDSAKL